MLLLLVSRPRLSPRTPAAAHAEAARLQLLPQMLLVDDEFVERHRHETERLLVAEHRQLRADHRQQLVRVDGRLAAHRVRQRRHRGDAAAGRAAGVRRRLAVEAAVPVADGAREVRALLLQALLVAAAAEDAAAEHKALVAVHHLAAGRARQHVAGRAAGRAATLAAVRVEGARAGGTRVEVRGAAVRPRRRRLLPGVRRDGTSVGARRLVRRLGRGGGRRGGGAAAGGGGSLHLLGCGGVADVRVVLVGRGGGGALLGLRLLAMVAEGVRLRLPRAVRAVALVGHRGGDGRRAGDERGCIDVQRQPAPVLPRRHCAFCHADAGFLTKEFNVVNEVQIL
eukprot:Rhum_TRINITY_DN14584_c2_g1::Rhum_TRINITY_DN14584_c2_g1_i1::g.99545::m.99545